MITILAISTKRSQKDQAKQFYCNDLVANLDLYQIPNAKSTLDGDLKISSDLESVTEIAALESTELDPAEVAREQATKALQATYRSRKVLFR